MTADTELRDKLRKIEALFAGATTPGERAAAGAAAGRIRERLRESEKTEGLVEMQFSLADLWSRQLFLALARRYGLRPYRYHRQKRTTVMLRAPRRATKTGRNDPCPCGSGRKYKRCCGAN